MAAPAKRSILTQTGEKCNGEETPGYGLLVIGFGTKACIPITHDPSPYHPPSGVFLHLPYAAGTDAGAEAAAYAEAGVDNVLVGAVLVFHA